MVCVRANRRLRAYGTHCVYFGASARGQAAFAVAQAVSVAAAARQFSVRTHCVFNERLHAYRRRDDRTAAPERRARGRNLRVGVSLIRRCEHHRLLVCRAAAAYVCATTQKRHKRSRTRAIRFSSDLGSIGDCCDGCVLLPLRNNDAAVSRRKRLFGRPARLADAQFSCREHDVYLRLAAYRKRKYACYEYFVCL